MSVPAKHIVALYDHYIRALNTVRQHCHYTAGVPNEFYPLAVKASVRARDELLADLKRFKPDVSGGVSIGEDLDTYKAHQISEVFLGPNPDLD